jgi:hypothetical protein
MLSTILYTGSKYLKTLHIKNIFEKENGDEYTKNALLYQDIIQYSIKTKNIHFKYQELGNWLINNNYEFQLEYSTSLSKSKTSKSYRLKIKGDRISNKIDDLHNLNLIYVSGTTKAEKVDNSILLYSLTGEGEFVAWLLERNNPTMTLMADEKLFAMIRLLLEKYPSSNTRLLLGAYDKSKHRNFFPKLIREIEILLSDGKFKNVSDAILWTIFSIKDQELDKNLGIVFLELLEESRSTPHLTKMLMYGMKMTQERKIFDQCPPIEWEDLWMRNSHNYDVIVLYGKCNTCNSKYPVEVKIDEKFLQSDYASEKLITIDCKICHASKSLYVSTDIPDRPMRLPKMNK